MREAIGAGVAGNPAIDGALPRDPFNGCRISPVVAAALCIKPRGLLTERQVARVDVLKRECADFAVMRALAMRFRGMIRGWSGAKLDTWIRDAMESGIHAMRRFASGLKRDLSAVRNAPATEWSSAQVEGQGNRLKTLKRAMYGRCGTEILRARMLPCRSEQSTIFLPDPL
jgi:transposase